MVSLRILMAAVAAAAVLAGPAAVRAGAHRWAPVTLEEMTARIEAARRKLGPRFSVDEMMEAVYASTGNRHKRISIDDAHDVNCPQAASLIYTTDAENFRIATPHFSLESLTNDRESHHSNARDFSFRTGDCRYIVTVKRFEKDGPGERETPLRRYDDRIADELVPSLKDLGERATTSPLPEVEVEGNKIIMSLGRVHPNKSGMSHMAARFDGRERDADFSGLLTMSRRSVTLFLVRMPADARLELKKNRDIKAYEIDISLSKVRWHLALIKEVDLNGSWTKVFGE